MVWDAKTLGQNATTLTPKPATQQQIQNVTTYRPSVSTLSSAVASQPTSTGPIQPSVFSTGVPGFQFSPRSFNPNQPGPERTSPWNISGVGPYERQGIMNPNGPNHPPRYYSPTNTAEGEAAGLNFMKPGAGEQFYADHKSDLLGPGATQQWFDQNQGRLGQPTLTRGYAESAIKNAAPLPSANMDPYYDRAEQLTTRRMTSEQAARGNYGSSVGINATGEAVAGLRAQQAKDEAEYGLSRARLGLEQTSMLGNLAQGADSAELAQFNAGLTGAAAAGSESLNRWRTTQGAAMDAQGAQRTRGQDFFNNNMAIGRELSGVAGNAYENAGAQDQALLDAIISLGIGSSAESVAAAMRRANEDADFRNSLIQAFAAYRAGSA